MGITIILAYATWALLPVVAYQALMAGLNGEGRRYAVFFAVYAATVIVTYLSLTADIARAGYSPVSPVAVLAPAIVGAVLSLALYLVGRRVGR